ncbi:carboxypeptidase B-like [Glandiceps talaboti]
MVQSMFNWAALIVLVACVVESQKRFDGHQVLRIQPENEDEIQAIKRLQQQYGESQVDFWKEPSDVLQPIDVMVSPDAADEIVDLFKGVEIRHNVMIDDVQALIDSQLQQRRRRRRECEEEDIADFDYGVYHTYDQIKDWTYKTAQQYDNITEIFKIAKSFEKRKIYALKISTGSESVGRKPSVFMVGGFHAREWISPATVMVIANQLLSNYGNDHVITRLVNEIEWYIVPLANPDGYIYTWTKERFWRKTRSTIEGNNCEGTDPNRNWDVDWGVAGSSDNPCSYGYHGPKPFSEREVKGIAAFLKKKTFDVYLDFHCYGQKWMSVWSYSRDLPPDRADQDRLSRVAVDAIKSVNGSIYTPGQISHQLGHRVSGTAADWTYNTTGIKYSFGIELRDNGRYGFLLPEDQIIDTGMEMTAAIKAIGLYLLDDNDGDDSDGDGDDDDDKEDF